MKFSSLRLLVVLALAAAVRESPATAEEGSALVTVATPHWGSLPDSIEVFGTAGPALDSNMTISLQSQGRVLGFAVTAGEAVKAGQPLLRFEVSQSALGSYRQAKTALRTANVDRARIAQMLAQQLVTKDQLNQADKAVADARTMLDTLDKSGAGQWDTTIKAPFDGVVTTIPVAQGDTIAPGAPMMTLMRADGLVVKVGIEPSQRFRTMRGDPVTLEPLTGGGAPATGTLTRIDGLLNPKTHLIDADIATKVPVLPGAMFRATILVGHFEGFIVPRDAVLTDAAGAYIFQLDGQKAHRLDVKIAGGNDRDTAVTGAIDPGKPIVVQGNYQLSDGMEVRQPDTSSPTASRTLDLGLAQDR